MPGSTTVDSFAIDRVIYASWPIQQEPGSTEVARINRVSTDPSIPINNLQPVQVSSETSGELASAMRRILQFDLTDPDNTALAYSNQVQNDAHPIEWKMVQLGDSDQTVPQPFPSHYTVVTTVRDISDTAKPGGWLVIDINADQTLKQVNLIGKEARPVHDQNGNEITNIKFVDMIGGEHSDGSQFISITFDDGNPNPGDDDDPLQGELWYFKRNDNPNANSIARPLLNSDGEKLHFDMKFLGLGAAVPNEEYIVTHEGDIYFFKHEGMGFFDLGAVLYRANKTGWEKLHGETIDILGDLDEDDDISFEDLFDMFDQDVDLEKGGPLVTAGDYLVWATGDELKSWHIPTGALNVLDDMDRHHDGSIPPKVTVSDISMTALGSRDGWVFYNRTLGDLSNLSKPVRTEYAVAVRIDDPGTEINIANARWIGASSSGTSSDDTKISRMELSEVFLISENGDLGAVSAANPPQGMVKLGNLSNVKEAALQGLAPGPYRLVRIKHDNNEEEVVFVNTREKNSLVRLTKDSGRNFEQAWPIRGF